MANQTNVMGAYMNTRQLIVLVVNNVKQINKI